MGAPPPKEPTPDTTPGPAVAVEAPKEPPEGVPDAPPIESPDVPPVVAFEAPQAANDRPLRTESSPVGVTASELDVGARIDAPQAPGPALSLDRP